jgi:O-antigen/teichoic acid export membrane protein
VAALLGGTSTVLVHGLYSLGRADLVLRLNLLWTTLLWVLAVLLVRIIGFTGFAAASAAVGATAPLTAWELRRHVPVRILEPLRVPLAAAATGGLVLAVLARLWVRDIPTLVAAIVGAAGTYVASAVLLAGAAWRAELLADWRRAWAFRT